MPSSHLGKGQETSYEDTPDQDLTRKAPIFSKFISRFPKAVRFVKGVSF